MQIALMFCAGIFICVGNFFNFVRHPSVAVICRQKTVMLRPYGEGEAGMTDLTGRPPATVVADRQDQPNRLAPVRSIAAATPGNTGNGTPNIDGAKWNRPID
jgi:hypothetical protein